MITTIYQLKDYIDLTVGEEQAVETVGKQYPWRITEYYASLMNRYDRMCPIRLQAIPTILELNDHFGSQDPLREESNSPVPGVIRVYPDRIAVVATNRCPVYCRFCLRKRFRREFGSDLVGARLQTVLSYIRSDRTIRDVLVTGGDPLMLGDCDLDILLGGISSVPHVEIVRLGTRAPCTWPERITESLADMLASHHPLWVNTQFNHPSEITPQAEKAVQILLSRGIPVGNQSVLLRGINDSVAEMMELVRKLVNIRVRPYYLYQAQALKGTEHFITSIEKGLEIIRGLRGYTTGFAVPQYVLDTPYGKIPLNPDYLHGRSGDYVEMASFSGKLWREHNPLQILCSDTGCQKVVEDTAKTSVDTGRGCLL